VTPQAIIACGAWLYGPNSRRVRHFRRPWRPKLTRISARFSGQIGAD